MDSNTFIINTARLIIRPLNINDLLTAHEYAGNIENTQYMIYLPNKTIKETEVFLKNVTLEWQKENPSFFEWAIILNGVHIGAISIYLEDNQAGEIGWIINKKYQGNGYATEAAKAVINFAKHYLNLNKIVAHCDYRNKPSASVMKKIGMHLESDKGIRKYKDSEELFQELMYLIIL